MIRQSTAKIFLAEQRGIENDPAFRCLHFFNGEYFYQKHKNALGSLSRFDDVLLAGRKERVLFTKTSAYVVLVPIYGAIEYTIDKAEPGLVAAGQVQVFSIPGNGSCTIYNPFSDIVVNYLELFIDKESGIPDMIPAPADADLNKFMNVLVQVAAAGNGSGDQWRLSIGKFSGRGETIYQRKKPENGLFFFVIEGVFEVAGRLLHARDGLALWDNEEAEIEALSHDALLLVLENPFSDAQP